MIKLFLIFIFILTTCTAFDESFDDHIILEKSKEKIIASLIKPQIRNTVGVTTRHTTRHIARYTSGVTTSHKTSSATRVTTKHSSKVQIQIPRKKSMKNSHIKGIDNLFTGKLGEEFRKQKDSVKKLIARLVKNNKWKSFLMKCRYYSGDVAEPHRGPCENLPRDLCKDAVNFGKIALKYS